MMEMRGIAGAGVPAAGKGRGIFAIWAVLAVVGGLLAADKLVAANPEQAAEPARIGGSALEKPTDAFSRSSRSTRHARVSDRNGAPAGQGQVWRDYDLRPYLARSKQQPEPEQQVIQWILRETGTERWFGATPGMIAFDSDRLRVFQVSPVHDVVGEIVDRFVDPDLSTYSVSVRLVTVESANWRAQAPFGMRSLPVQTPGLEAWLMPREDAAVLLAMLRSRIDFREHNSGVQIPHGQSHVLERWQPRVYRQSVDWGQLGRGPQIQMGQLQEGYRLQLNPLAHADHQTMDCVVKCHVDQVERMSPVWLEMPTYGGKAAGLQIEVPQVASWRIQERFRWPVDQVLLVSRGVVAMPGLRPDARLPLPSMLGGGPARADALLFLECRDDSRGALPERTREARAIGPNYRGRY
ncbi:MAG: hypothetical protein KDB23_09795 [Planctomycetales bacterium]|nr:hypothetical protein [Planctomycetales bacterium]